MIGLLRHYLGIKIRRNNEEFYCIKQEEYIQKILYRFGLSDAKISTVPLDQEYEKCRNDGSQMPQNTKYQQLIGALLYLAVNTRPDIAPAIGILS